MRSRSSLRFGGEARRLGARNECGRRFNHSKRPVRCVIACVERVSLCVVIGERGVYLTRISIESREIIPKSSYRYPLPHQRAHSTMDSRPTRHLISRRTAYHSRRLHDIAFLTFIAFCEYLSHCFVVHIIIVIIVIVIIMGRRPTLTQGQVSVIISGVIGT